MLTISSYAVTYQERGFSSKDSSWESDPEPSPLPKMVRESTLLKRKKQKSFVRGKKNRGGKGRGGTVPVPISKKEKRKQDSDSEDYYRAPAETTLAWRLRSQAKKEVKILKLRLAATLK